MTEIKRIEELHEAALRGEKHRDEDMNYTLFWAYIRSKEAENELIDFNDCIWDHDVEQIVRILKENGVTEFTISSTFSSLIEILAEFNKHGVTMNGLTTVNASYTDFSTGKRAAIPAIKMTIA